MDKGVGAEERGEGARADDVDDTRLEVDLDRAGDVLLVRGLVKVDRDYESACARVKSPAQLTLVELLVVVTDVLAVACASELRWMARARAGRQRVSALRPRRAHGGRSACWYVRSRPCSCERQRQSGMQRTWRMFSQKAVPIWLPAARQWIDPGVRRAMARRHASPCPTVWCQRVMQRRW